MQVLGSLILRAEDTKAERGDGDVDCTLALLLLTIRYMLHDYIYKNNEQPKINMNDVEEGLGCC